MINHAIISPPDLNIMMESEPVVVIDTRSPEAFAEGHIPNAINIHDIFTFLATSSEQGIEELREKFAETFGAAGLSGIEHAVVYEESMNTGFGQSCRGYFLLKYLGYPKASVLHGGYQAWLEVGLESSTDVFVPDKKIFPVDEASKSLMLSKDDMRAALDNDDIIKLDVRDVDEWVGTSSSPYGVDFCPRKGRLPNAVWIEWYRMMKPSSSGSLFKSKAEIQAECASVGINSESAVYLYCFKGARASNTFVALKEAGVKDVRMYFGSWNEWSRDPDLPIDDTVLSWKAA